MNKALKRRFKNISLLITIVILVGIGTGIYVTLGPFREFFWNMPYMAGMLGRQHYLVLLQNNHELRPSGGFITAAARVTMTFGVPSIKVFDSYAIPDPSPRIPAPEPFEYLIGQGDAFFGGWTFRDANFSPSIDKSAQEVIRMYQIAFPEEEIDAVVALDFSVIERFLHLYGPLTIEDTVFDQDNFFSLSQRISKNVDTHNAEELKNRKNILQPFVKTLIKKMIGQPTQYHNLMTSLGELAKEKHYWIYHQNEDLQQKFIQADLSPIITAPESDTDVVHVNVANIGGRKADRYMSKEVRYRADFSNPENPLSKLEITLEHLGSYNIQSDIYQAYLRSYVPRDAVLVRSEGNTLRSTSVYEDLDMTVFADYVRLRPGEKVVISYWYRLPETILPENYRLKIIKQPGVDQQYWHVAVRQVNDSSLKNTPDPNRTRHDMTIRENLASWQGILENDLSFDLYQQFDNQGPIVLWQKFVDLETINVRFNERIDPLLANDPANYSVTDLNESDAQIDEVTILSAEFDERDLWLKVSGVTQQEEEHYQLILKNITDINGNPTSPSPLTRTLVQRINDEG